MNALSSEKMSVPDGLYSSPLRRCLKTLEITFRKAVEDQGKPFKPAIKELLRERLGVHTCDRRSNRTWIQKSYPKFSIEDRFTENDELWDSNVRETLDEHTRRTSELLVDLFENDNSMFMYLSVHSGTIMSIFRATGYLEIPVAAGAIFPLLIRAKRCY